MDRNFARALPLVLGLDLSCRLAWLEPVAARQRSAGSLFLAESTTSHKEDSYDERAE